MFCPIPAASSKSKFDDTIVKTSLTKWDLVRHSNYFRGSYTKYYHVMQAEQFSLDLFNDQAFQKQFKYLDSKGNWKLLNEPVSKVNVEIVPTTLTRMDLFDKLQDAPSSILRPNGEIVKCFDNYIDGIQISDMLRDFILNDESENAEGVLNDLEKSEFLWRLFEHLVIGGPCCQFEDNLSPYLDVCKVLYKEFLSARRNPVTKEIEIASVVYKITGIELAEGDKNSTSEGIKTAGKLPLFPVNREKGGRNSFCYIAVDPIQRLCKVWYQSYIPFW
mmetsp:Transcript_11731/g.21080  ORF Transcript_11731/g.21080 Transcript_11731/m.21080 type:complete len:275 (-) Transcript_11731:234-1058(-)